MHENASLLQVLEFGVGKEFEKEAFARYKLPTPVPPHVIYFLVSQETYVQLHTRVVLLDQENI